MINTPQATAGYVNPKKKKNSYWKTRDRVTPAYAMASPLELQGKTNKMKPNNMNTSRNGEMLHKITKKHRDQCRRQQN